MADAIRESTGEDWYDPVGVAWSLPEGEVTFYVFVVVITVFPIVSLKIGKHARVPSDTCMVF